MPVIRNKVLGGAAFIVGLWALQYYSGALELDRQLALSGELWRFWTGHFVHANTPHLLLNVIAALAIYFLFFPDIKHGELIACGFIFPPLISIGLLFIYPELNWYNGLSGLLHALVSFFSIRMIKDGKMVFGLGLGFVWLKVLIEAVRANLGYEYIMGEMTVITQAHLIGTSIGTIAGIIGMVLRPTGTYFRRVVKSMGPVSID